MVDDVPYCQGICDSFFGPLPIYRNEFGQTILLSVQKGDSNESEGKTTR